MQRDSIVQDELLEILDLAQAFVRDLDGTIRFWSTGATRLYQWTAEEAVGRISHDLLRTQFPQPIEEIQKIVLSCGSWRGEVTHRARNGEQVSVASHWSLYRNPSSGVSEIVEVNHDISELKQAHRELARLRRENEAQLDELKILYQTSRRLSSIVESSNDAIISKSLDGNVISWNVGAERMFGFAADEVMGKSIAVFPEPQFLAPLASQSIESVEEKVEVHEVVGRRKDGRLIDISLTVSPLYDSHGRMAGISNIARDVTEKKRSERRLLETNEELRQFAFAAAHDLQEPIRNISLYTQLVNRRNSGVLDKRSLEGLGVILNSANRMRALAQDLLAYTKATTGPDIVEPVESRAALNSALESLDREVIESGAVLTVDENLPRVLMHSTHLVEIFRNLISNSIKYRRPGVPRVEIHAEQQGGICTFSIRDNGIGIDRQHWGRIFGLFKRLHGQAIPGTGVGLAVCLRIISHYGGRIWVDSVVDRGSTFFFTSAVAHE